MTPDTARMPDFCNRKRPVHLVTGLAILQKFGVDISRIAMVAEGEYENYKGEIRKQEPAAGEAITAATEVKLWVGVYTAVDHLPYQFFHGFGGVDQSATWEQNARHLFAPFDAALLSSRAKALHEGVKYNFGSIDEDHFRRFLALFEQNLARTKMELRDALLWAGLMPTYHHWAGNAEAVGHVLTTFIRLPVTIIESVPRRFDIPSDVQYKLGSGAARLGEATVLGATFVECDAAYAVRVTNVPPERVTDLLPDGGLRTKLEQLLATCMPGHLEHDIEIEVAHATSNLGSAAGDARLGYSLRLTNNRGAA